MRICTLFLLLLSINIYCQSENKPMDRPKCANDKFDKVVDGYLSYTVPLVGVEEVEKMEDVVLLDAREWEEFKTSHIPNAQFIGYDNFNPSLVSGVDKDAKIVVYCSIGYRSEKIGEQLKELGYDNVQNLYGSIFEWVNQGKTIVNMDEEPTKKIHTYDKKWSKYVLNKTAEKVY